jgi:hypothetical protein
MRRLWAHNADHPGVSRHVSPGHDYPIIALLLVVVYLMWQAKKAEEHMA